MILCLTSKVLLNTEGFAVALSILSCVSRGSLVIQVAINRNDSHSANSSAVNFCRITLQAFTSQSKAFGGTRRGGSCGMSVQLSTLPLRSWALYFASYQILWVKEQYSGDLLGVPRGTGPRQLSKQSFDDRSSVCLGFSLIYFRWPYMKLSLSLSRAANNELQFSAFSDSEIFWFFFFSPT